MLYLIYYSLFVAFFAIAAVKLVIWYPHLVSELPQRARDVRATIDIYGVSAMAFKRMSILALSFVPLIGAGAYLMRYMCALVLRLRNIFTGKTTPEVSRL
jgi:hypothetical protein